MVTTIKIKRKLGTEFSQVTDTIQYGEPAYVQKDSNAYLVVGQNSQSTTTVGTSKGVRLMPISVMDKVLFLTGSNNRTITTLNGDGSTDLSTISITLGTCAERNVADSIVSQSNDIPTAGQVYTLGQQLSTQTQNVSTTVQNLSSAFYTFQTSNTPIDSVTSGSVKPVTSNAVYLHKPYHVGSQAPQNTNILWIDTSENDLDGAGLKYHNGTGWVVVPVAFS